jgi:hypothetical protein
MAAGIEAVPVIGGTRERNRRRLGHNGVVGCGGLGRRNDHERADGQRADQQNVPTADEGTGNAVNEIPRHLRAHPPMQTHHDQNIGAEAASTAVF